MNIFLIEYLLRILVNTTVEYLWYYCVIVYVLLHNSDSEMAIGSSVYMHSVNRSEVSTHLPNALYDDSSSYFWIFPDFEELEEFFVL